MFGILKDLWKYTEVLFRINTLKSQGRPLMHLHIQEESSDHDKLCLAQIYSHIFLNINNLPI